MAPSNEKWQYSITERIANLTGGRKNGRWKILAKIVDKTLSFWNGRSIKRCDCQSSRREIMRLSEKKLRAVIFNRGLS